jgi:hypothetical protein
MTVTPTNNWGPLGIIAALTGIASWFLGGFVSLILGMVAVGVGFIGNRMHQKLSQTGMIVGAFPVLFVNLMNLGIVPMPASLESDKSHLINSINASIGAFDVMKNKKLQDKAKEKFLNHCRNALQEARTVNIAEIERQVPGFKHHYEDEFIMGMESLIEGYENSDFSRKIKGGLLLDKWALWNRENNKRLGKIKEPDPSLFLFIKGSFYFK